MPTAHQSLRTTQKYDDMENSTTPPPPATTPHWLSIHSHSHLLSVFLVALNVLLVLLLYVCFYKFFFRKQPSSSSSHHRSNTTSSSPDSSPPSSPLAGRGGLELQVCNSLPVIEFKSNGTEKVECAVCLAEFKDGDKARVLPQCRHQFHVECVDTWFRSHTNCPLCRTPVEEKPGAGSESLL